MLAEERRRRPDRGRRRRQLERRRDLASAAEPRMRRPRPSRPAAHGEANAAATSLIGPAGISAASRAASHSAVVRSAKRAASVGISSARFATRSPFVANRGSSARAGSPSARQNRGHWRSLPTATAIVPSAVSNVSYGTMFGWALPSRPGDSPPTNAFWAWLTRAARVEPRSETSIRWPAPAAPSPRARAPTSAARIATAPFSPVRTSLIATPTFVGPPPSVVGRAGDRHQPGLGLDHEVVAGPRRIRAPPGRSR